VLSTLKCTPTEAAKYPTSVLQMPNMPSGFLESESCAKPDQGSGEDAADLAPLREGQIHHHQQRHLHEAENGEIQPNVDLKEDGQQRDDNKNPGAKTGDRAIALAEHHAPGGVRHYLLVLPVGSPLAWLEWRVTSVVLVVAPVAGLGLAAAARRRLARQPRGRQPARVSAVKL